MLNQALHQAVMVVEDSGKAVILHTLNLTRMVPKLVLAEAEANVFYDGSATDKYTCKPGGKGGAGRVMITYGLKVPGIGGAGGGAGLWLHYFHDHYRALFLRRGRQ